ncbi:MAG: dephospho-CoA kinase [Pseudomonadota bacterium]
MQGLMRIGLTGGIASGKTQASDHFGKLGASIIDTDVIARDVVATGTEGLNEIVERFGQQMLNDQGELDRAALRQVVFNDPDARQRLEQITHPRIQSRCWQDYQDATGHYVIFVVPLLVGSPLAKAMDRIVTVDCSEATQLLRIQARDGDDLIAAQRIIAAQADRETRLALADDVIVNEASLEELQAAVERLHTFYCRIL